MAKINIEQQVDDKVGGGYLRQALNRSPFISQREVTMLIDQATKRRRLRGRCVDSGEVRAALERAYWTDNEIEVLFYR